MAQDDIQGQVVDPSGNPVSGAIVELTRSYESNPVEEQTVLRTTTDSNGNYIFEEHPDGDGTTQDYHVSCYNYDGTAYVNSNNNPGVSAALPEFDIPDSVVHQYPVSTFTTSTWSDNVGSADMTVNGLSANTFGNGEDSVLGDGSSDHGLVTNGPRDLPSNETFGVAFTIEYTSLGGHVFAATDGSGDNRFRVLDEPFFDSSSGELNIEVSDRNSNGLVVETNDAFDDGNPHAVVINKTSNSNFDFYVDDMTSSVATSKFRDNGFNHNNYNPTKETDLAFFSNTLDGSVFKHGNFEAGVFEFNSDPYNQSERLEFVNRRPEV